MKQEDIRFLIVTAIFYLALFGAAALLTGCESAKYIVKCTIAQPENCN